MHRCPSACSRRAIPLSASNEIENILALSRITAEAATANGPEEALWCITRNVPALLGDPSAALRPGAFREAGPLAATSAAVAFMRTPNAKHHLITAPVNFLPEQHHELVDITLGHPGEIAHSRRPLLLRDTTLHSSFVKILQTFKAGSTLVRSASVEGRLSWCLDLCERRPRHLQRA